jgi:lysophospholipase L1-like esterase
MIPKFRLVTLAFAAACMAAAGTAGGQAAHTKGAKWVGTWASAQQEPEPHNAVPTGALHDSTLRQLVRTSVAGSQIRVRVSNAFGRTPLRIKGVNVALAATPSSSRIATGTDRAATFSGARQIAVPAGAEYVSDPIGMKVPALTTLSISMHIAEHPAVQTGHPGSRATSYFARGDQLSAPELAGSTSVDHWYQLSGVDVVERPARMAVAVLGDSITDGYGVKPNTNSRWPDFLAERLQASATTRGIGVLNLGIGGNRVLQDGLGPNAAARFERDVLGRSGVRYVIILVGVNDLGGLTRDAPVSAAAHEVLVAQMITASSQIVRRARERGIRVIGGTIMPYGGSAYYHPDEANEADRQAVNAWLRKPGNVDAVIDFDRAMRDPARPHLLRKEYDSGDGLHPSIAGYRAMAAAVPLSLFERR